MTHFLRSSSSSSSSVRFVDLALSTTGPRSLSYVHQNLKWIIREHVLSLIKEFPTLSPSSDHFTQEDGITFHLLCVHGGLPLACSRSALVAIWLHQSYPFVPPIVYLSSASAAEIDRSNPLVDASTGAASTPYLKTWQYPNSNLCDLVRNLVYVFTQWPPFVSFGPSQKPIADPPPGWASLASKREATDRLYVSLSRDVGVFKAQTDKEIESLVSIQGKLKERTWTANRGLEGLVKEKEKLSGMVVKMEERADVVRSWLWANNSVPPAVAEAAPEEVFEVMDDKSKFVLKNEAESLAIDDVVWVLDEALMKRTVEFHGYIKQVRVLYREQFFHAAMLNKLQQQY
ncbi:unnamed protein product [Spirodela intermedia]|uniref:Uncharacterized protein n=1 Tax=Spirodela intermedia TaxID=51605 RepID=A0A7I8KQ27_SPIIN|nr:unnamed protein product [Spirodela intermedia]